ncbi:MAG: DUF2283 domain-containing protein [Hormoscilla sp.]
MSTLIKYDEVSDTLRVNFERGAIGTGIELTDHILLRIDRQAGKAISLILLDYSILSQNTEMGRRSFPLTGLSDLSRELQELVGCGQNPLIVRTALPVAGSPQTPLEKGGLRKAPPFGRGGLGGILSNYF